MKNYRASKQSDKEKAKNNAYMKKYRDVCGTLENNECQNILNVAPAESKRQLSIFRDKHSEKLAHPGIFLGHKRPENEHSMVKVHFSDISKPELPINHSTAFLVEVQV